MTDIQETLLRLKKLHEGRLVSKCKVTNHGGWTSYELKTVDLDNKTDCQWLTSVKENQKIF